MKPILLHGHERALTRVKFNLEGDLLFSAAKDKSPCVWFTHSGERLGTYKGHNGAVWNLDVDYTSTHLLTASADFSVRLWDVKTGKDVKFVFSSNIYAYAHSHLKARRSPPSAQSRLCARLAGHTVGSNVFTVPIAPWASNPSFAFSTRNSSSKRVSERSATAPFPDKLSPVIVGASAVPYIVITAPGETKVSSAIWGPLDETIIIGLDNGHLYTYDSKVCSTVKFIRSRAHTPPP